MNLLEAIKSGRRFSLKEVYYPIQYFTKGTGPYQYLVDCDYFIICGEFSTSLDLDADEFLAEYWFIDEHI